MTITYCWLLCKGMLSMFASPTQSVMHYFHYFILPWFHLHNVHSLRAESSPTLFMQTQCTLCACAIYDGTWYCSWMCHVHGTCIWIWERILDDGTCVERGRTWPHVFFVQYYRSINRETIACISLLAFLELKHTFVKGFWSYIPWYGFPQITKFVVQKCRRTA